VVEGPLWAGELSIRCRAKGDIHEKTSGDYAFHDGLDDITIATQDATKSLSEARSRADWSNWKAVMDREMATAPDLAEPAYKAGPSQPVKMLLSLTTVQYCIRPHDTYGNGARP
jgi:hypothetical protein